jgi:hypothetical protein
MWNAEPLLFDDEDETALKARFVELWAKYPDRSIVEIGDYIFKDLRNPEMRGAQWAMRWAKDLEVLEAVKKLRQGQTQTDVASKTEIINSAWALAHSDRVDAKDRVAALKLIAEMQGMIEKNINKKTEEVKRRMPNIVFERYAD